MYWRICLKIMAIACLLVIVISSACIEMYPYRPTDEMKAAFNTSPISGSLVIKPILQAIKDDKSASGLDLKNQRIRIFDGNTAYYVSVRPENLYRADSLILGGGHILVLSKDSLKVQRVLREQ